MATTVKVDTVVIGGGHGGCNLACFIEEANKVNQDSPPRTYVVLERGPRPLENRHRWWQSTKQAKKKGGGIKEFQIQCAIGARNRDQRASMVRAGRRRAQAPPHSYPAHCSQSSMRARMLGRGGTALLSSKNKMARMSFSHKCVLDLVRCQKEGSDASSASSTG